MRLACLGFGNKLLDRIFSTFLFKEKWTKLPKPNVSSPLAALDCEITFFNSSSHHFFSFLPTMEGKICECAALGVVNVLLTCSFFVAFYLTKQKERKKRNDRVHLIDYRKGPRLDRGLLMSSSLEFWFKEVLGKLIKRGREPGARFYTQFKSHPPSMRWVFSCKWWYVGFVHSSLFSFFPFFLQGRVQTLKLWPPL